MKINRRRSAARLGTVALMGWTGGCDLPQERVETLLQSAAREPSYVPRHAAIAAHEDADGPTLADDLAMLAGELTLEDARRRAWRANPDIHAAQARLEGALARIGEAQAAYYPNLTLTVSSARTFLTPSLQGRISLPATSAIPFLPFLQAPDMLNLGSILTALSSPLLQARGFGGGDQNAYSQHSATFTAAWTLFDGFARRARVLAFRHNYRASQFDRADVERLIGGAVDMAYHQAQLAREQLRVALADESFSREQLSEAQKRLGAQTATRDEVLNFQVRLLAAGARVTAATGMRDMARVLLAELMALPGVRWPDGLDIAPLSEESAQELQAPDADEWVDRALKARSDLSAAAARLESAAANVRLAKGQFSPALNASGSYGYEKRSTFELSKDDQASGVALEMRWQIFTGGFRTSQLRRAEAERREAAAGVERARNNAVGDVRRAVIGVADAQMQITLQRSALEAATENRRIVQAQYLAGTAGLVRLNEAQRDYVEADANLATARIRLRQAWSDLETAAGSGRTEVDKPME